MTKAANGWRVLALVLVFHAWPATGGYAGWTVTPRGSMLLDPASVAAIRELSGVTYLGPAGGGLERFAAIQDAGNRLVIVDVGFGATGTITSAAAVSAVTLSAAADYEGIVYTGPARNTVFVSEETTPGVREFDLAGGVQLANVGLPPVYQSHRANRGLESLTRSTDGRTMWTSNEEALSVDGPVATQNQGTVVRLQRLADDGASVTAGGQFVYEVEPVHAANPDRSGLVELVTLPDDTLLALERSAALALPPFRSRIYQVNLHGATDTSGPAFADGLAGKMFTPVGKTLLWSGQAGTALGENLEGLALGQVLASGNRVLLGVVDNAGTGGNRLVSFEIALAGCALSGDYNCNGAVDDADYTLWKNTFGSNDALAADGNGNGTVDAADYTVWRNALATTTDAASTTSRSAVHLAVPEPALTGVLGPLLLWLNCHYRRRAHRSRAAGSRCCCASRPGAPDARPPSL